MKRIAIFGRGRIGTAIASMLTDIGYPAFAIYEPGEWENSDVFDMCDVFIAAVPWYETLKIAYQVSRREGKIYLDLTEDVAIGSLIRDRGSKSIMIPHCGLAPGAVSIIAGSMLPCEELYIAVGAIPVFPVGALKYDLTWSTDGLINEYIRPCPAISWGKKVLLEPLDDVRTFGRYEAFNTSGGLGTLVDTLEPACMRRVKYQSIRYKGHADLMRFMRDDMGFGKKPMAWVKLLDENLLRNREDKVLIEVNGYRKDIRGNDHMSAIQRATAAGLVSVLLWALAAPLNKRVRPGNWIANEDIPLSEIREAKCWKETYEQ